MASATAFLSSQLLDVWMFDKLRHKKPWWRAPLVSTTVSSGLDSGIFATLAWYGTDMPWITLGLGDWGAKVGLAVLSLGPFGSSRRGRSTSSTGRAGAAGKRRSDDPGGEQRFSLLSGHAVLLLQLGQVAGPDGGVPEVPDASSHNSVDHGDSTGFGGQLPSEPNPVFACDDH